MGTAWAPHGHCKHTTAHTLHRLDLYLVHWPCRDAADTRETWRGMEALVAAGTVRSIGLSNPHPDPNPNPNPNPNPSPNPNPNPSP